MTDQSKEKKDELKTFTSLFNVIGKPRVDTLTSNRNVMIRFKNWEFDNNGKSREQINDNILEKEKDRIKKK